MILTADTAQLVYKFILADDAYEQILGKFVPKKEQRDEFRQFMWEIICSQPEEKLLNSWNQMFFKYWFVSVVKNQIQSNNSPWHKKERLAFQSDELLDHETPDLGMTYEDIDNYNYQKSQLNIIEDALNYWSKKDPHFRTERECFQLYYYNNLSYRKISKKIGIPTPSVYIYVQSAQTKVKGFINNKRYLD